jgi:RNA polymerase sigma-70 factor, ECF subfamily
VRDHGKNRRTSFWKRLVGLEDRSTNDEPREFATPQPSPERVLLAREQLQSILNAVSSLPTQQRSVFLLRFAEEMSLAQIADILDVKVGTVKAQLARATGKLREMKERQWR